MKTCLLIFLTFMFVDADIANCRRMMDLSVDDKRNAGKFYKQMKAVKESDEPIMVGFKGMAEILMCKHVLNPFTRLSHFNKGKEFLEMAIKRSANNPELLFFRLSTQTNVPSLLKYNENINHDKEMLIGYLVKNKDLVKPDSALYKRIKNYLLINKYCSAQEKALIRTL